jgi:hypothetical protein
MCPLVAANTQVCDIVVEFTKSGYRLWSSDKDLVLAQRNLHDHFMTLALTARNNHKLKKGQSWSQDNSEYTLCVECLRKNKFKICFHTTPEIESEKLAEDPIVPN